MNSFPLVRKQFALEVGVVNDLQSTLSGVFPDFMVTIKDFAAKFTSTEPVVGLTGKQSAFLSVVVKHNFAEIEALGAYVPEGMKVTYLEYIEVLRQAVGHAKTVSGSLGAYTSYIAQLVTNLDMRKDTSSMSRDFLAWEKARVELNDAMGACFTHGGTRSQVTFAQVVRRNSDWAQVFHEATTLFHEISSVNREQLRKKVKECSDLLDIVMKKLQNHEFANVSPQAANNLAEGAYAVGCELENFAAVFYKTQALNACINQTVEHFQEVFKK